MPPVFANCHSCARWKALSLAHSAACYQEHTPGHTQLCTRYTLVWGLKCPRTQSPDPLDLPVQCIVLPQLEVVQIYTEMCIPKTDLPEIYSELRVIKNDWHILTATRSNCKGQISPCYFQSCCCGVGQDVFVTESLWTLVFLLDGWQCPDCHPGTAWGGGSGAQ